MRIYTRIVIKLFLFISIFISNFAFSFVVNDSYHSKAVSSCSPYSGKTLGSCISQAKNFLISFNKPLSVIFTNDTLSYGAFVNGAHKYVLIVNYYYIASNGEHVYRYERMEVYFNSILPEPPTCNSDQILNPVTNTCDPRCTAPDVWDPVTQQCVTEKNRCDILGQRQPVVEVDWRQSTLGSSFVGHHACMPSGCVVTGTKDVGCLSDSDRCYGDAKYTGTECTYTEGVTSGWCSDETCSDQTPVEPVPDPDNPNPEPPSPNPDPTPGDGFTPPNPDTSADPNNPNLEEEGNKGVVNELNTANKLLENIDKTLDTTLKEITAQNKDVDKANDKLVLGINNLTAAVKKIPGGGGDGDGVGDAAVASFNCDAETFQCKGDVIQCLSAEIQFKEHCLNSELKQLEASFKKIASVDNVKAIVQEEEVDLSKIDTKYLNGSGLKVSGQCPPDYTFTVDIYIQTTVTIPLTDLCAAVQRFAPLIILFGWVSGIGLIGRQQGVF